MRQSYFLLGKAVLTGALVLLRLKSLNFTPRSTFQRLKTLRPFDDSTQQFTGGAHDYGPAFAINKPYSKAVVCIGGFGDTPGCWQPLVEEFGASNANRDSIILTPPTHSWHKWDNFKSARSVSYKDWLRDCLREIKLANTLSDFVTVVAHSTGVLPVVFCLSKLSSQGVDKVVFTGANLKPSLSDLSSKKLLLSPLGRVIRFAQPIIPKKLRKGSDGKTRPVDTLNERYHNTGFYLQAFPLNAVIQMWRLQDKVRTLLFLRKHDVKKHYL